MWYRQMAPAVRHFYLPRLSSLLNLCDSNGPGNVCNKDSYKDMHAHWFLNLLTILQNSVVIVYWMLQDWSWIAGKRHATRERKCDCIFEDVDCLTLLYGGLLNAELYSESPITIQKIFALNPKVFFLKFTCTKQP